MIDEDEGSCLRSEMKRKIEKTIQIGDQIERSKELWPPLDWRLLRMLPKTLQVRKARVVTRWNTKAQHRGDDASYSSSLFVVRLNLSGTLAFNDLLYHRHHSRCQEDLS